MKRALCVGINNYPGTDSDLYGCINDMQDWAHLLKNAFGCSVKTLTNEAATKQNIEGELAEDLLHTKSDDLYVFTFSGHGSFIPDKDGDEPDGVDEVLVPANFDQGFITDDTLNKLLSSVSNGTVVFISDCCHSGTVSRLFQVSSCPRRPRFLPPSLFLPEIELVNLPPRRRNFNKTLTSTVIERLSPSIKFVHLSGCADTEYSYDSYFKGRPNGAFTRSAIDVLDDVGLTATYSAWFNAIRSKLPNVEYPQSPQFNGPDSLRRKSIFS